MLRVVFFAFTLFSAPALACPGSTCACGAHAEKSAHHGDELHAASMLSHAVTLTDDQRADIDALELSFKAEIAPIQERIQDLHDGLSELDEAARDELKGEIHALAAEKKALHETFRADLLDLLGAEQRVAAEELFASHHGVGKEAHGHGGHKAHGHGGHKAHGHGAHGAHGHGGDEAHGECSGQCKGECPHQ